MRHTGVLFTGWLLAFTTRPMKTTGLPALNGASSMFSVCATPAVSITRYGSLS